MHTASLQSIMIALKPWRSRSAAVDIHTTCSGFHQIRLQDAAADILQFQALKQAPGSGGLRHYIAFFKLHTAAAVRKVRRPGESEESQTSGVRGLATNSDCIRHRMGSTLCRICACQHTLTVCQPLPWHKIFNRNPENLSHLRQIPTNLSLHK